MSDLCVTQMEFTEEDDRWVPVRIGDMIRMVQSWQRRYECRLRFMEQFENWVKSEPSPILFWRWHRWLKQRPSVRGVAHDE